MVKQSQKVLRRFLRAVEFGGLPIPLLLEQAPEIRSQVAGSQRLLRNEFCGREIVQRSHEKRIFRKLASLRVENRHMMREHIGDNAVSWFGDDDIDSAQQIFIAPLRAL